jgi:hypothetical protein
MTPCPPPVKAARALPPREPVSREEFDALADRVLYLEAALHHVLDAARIDPHSLPDPIGRLERRVDNAYVALATLGLDVELPPVFADADVQPHIANTEGVR